MTTHTAFFYGTLMSPAVLHSVLQRRSNPPDLTITPAILPSHARHRVKKAPYPGVVPSSAEHSVRGTLVTGLTDAHMTLLDAFEGDEYERRHARVLISKSTPPLSQSESLPGNGPRSGGSEGLVTAGAGEEQQQEVEAETYVWIAGLDQLEDQEWDFDHFVKENMGHFLIDEGLSVVRV